MRGYNEAGRCQQCGNLFEVGRREVCNACLRKRNDRRKRRYHPLRCDCGRKAVKVLVARVGTEAGYTIRMPVCQECLRLEVAMQEGRGEYLPPLGPHRRGQVPK